MPKIKYGLRNVHYAIATIASDGTATYGTPVPVPGAVNLNADAQGSMDPFYADDIVYYTGISNQGYEGDLEMALLPDAFRKAVLGELEDSNGVLLEDMDASVVHFALLFEFANDDRKTRHVLYNCTATRPSVSGSTKNESIEPQTETVTIKATSIYVAALTKDLVKASVPSTVATQYNGWFTAVYQPTALASSSSSGTTTP